MAEAKLLDNSSEFFKILKNKTSMEVYNPQEKDSPPIEVEFTPSTWKVKTYLKSRNRMKIDIKLSGEEAEAWMNFQNTIKPEDMISADFIKAMFLTGIEATNKKLSQAINEYVLENQANLSSSGIEIDTEGDVPIIKSFGDLEVTEDGEETTKIL